MTAKQPKTKVCRVCSKRKPTDRYYANGHGGTESRCKDCHRARSRQTGAAWRERQRGATAGAQ